MTIIALQAANKVSQIGTAADLNKFTDAEKLAKYASEDMATMIKMGFINGQGNNILSPTGATNRSEAAQVLYNIYLQQ